jgi:TolB-like protein/DNA-binding winged helix-turn-helix (wHTH) protein/Tfp pilus assembly protein PilF
MVVVKPPVSGIQFGLFELDLQARELRKQGVKIKLQEQPFQVLTLLLEHAGEVVTKDELRERIWAADTFVDFDHGLHSVITRLRETLGDSSDSPHFIETLARRGYRFIAPVKAIGKTGDLDVSSQVLPWARDPLRRLAWSGLAGLLLVVLLLAAFLSLNLGGLRRQWPPWQSNPTIRSLAVLPLENLSGDPSQEYFVDGMTEALITDLAKVSAMRVISRQSAMSYKGSKKTLPEIASELHVDALIEGTAARSGDRVRITVNLVQASPERHLWAETYQTDITNTLALQADFAQTIVSQLRVHLTPQEQTNLARARPASSGANELYLRGRFYFNKGVFSDWQKSGEYFEQAIAKDPSFAPAYAGLANFYAREAMVGPLTPQQAWPKAEETADRALHLDEMLAEPHAVIAQMRLFRDWNWTAAEKEYTRALELSPNSADVHSSYAYYLRCVGRLDMALQEDKRALELDPFREDLSNHLGFDLDLAGKYEEAVYQFRHSLKLDPDGKGTHMLLANTYEHKGMYDEGPRNRSTI